jgi:hypothetical protein
MSQVARTWTLQAALRAIPRLALASALLIASTVLRPTVADADPILIPGTDVGAQLPNPDINILLRVQLPRTEPVPGQPCAFRYKDQVPPGVTIKHVAPCGSNGSPGDLNSPWATIAHALRALQPGQVAYIHGDTNVTTVDYREANLAPGNDGTKATPIRLVAAPGETPPLLGPPSNLAAGTPLLRLIRPWWLIDGLHINGASDQVRVRPGAIVEVKDTSFVALRRLDITGVGARAQSSANAAITFLNAKDVALLGSHIHEPLSGSQRTDRPLNEPPLHNVNDNQGVKVLGPSDRVLLRGNHSYGHNGDSVQCGDDPTQPKNVTIEANRYHQDEENAVDVKSCISVTIRGNKFFGYFPARDYATRRSPHGDAVIVNRTSGGLAPDKVLIERNRFFYNSRAMTISPDSGTTVVRRNLIFSGLNIHCGLGAGIRAAGKHMELYHNTLHNLPGPQPTKPTACARMPSWWTPSEGAAVRINDQHITERVVLWNNIIATATLHLQVTTPNQPLDAARNLFDVRPSTLPPDSKIGDPMFINDPVENDYYTQPGSPARDMARLVPPGVNDPTNLPYCDDPADQDEIAQPDIGFLESCF